MVFFVVAANFCTHYRLKTKSTMKMECSQLRLCCTNRWCSTFRCSLISMVFQLRASIWKYRFLCKELFPILIIRKISKYDFTLFHPLCFHSDFYQVQINLFENYAGGRGLWWVIWMKAISELFYKTCQNKDITLCTITVPCTSGCSMMHSSSCLMMRGWRSFLSGALVVQ